MPKHTKLQNIRTPLPYKHFIDGIEIEGCTKHSLPKTFNWSSLDVDSLYTLFESFGLKRKQKQSYITKSMNQNLPTFCGSSWAHAAVSVLADRIKIIRMIYMDDDDEDDDEEGENAYGYGYGDHKHFPDISLSVQFLLNCGGEVAGSCNGGSATGAFQFIKEVGYIPFETCQPYMACSSDSNEELCKYVDTTCTPMNICKTCTREIGAGGTGTGTGVCSQISQFPKARSKFYLNLPIIPFASLLLFYLSLALFDISKKILFSFVSIIIVDEYGTYRLSEANSIEEQIFLIKSEISIRGPVTTGIAAYHLQNYTGGIIYDDESFRDLDTTHEVSIIGWGVEEGVGVDIDDDDYEYDDDYEEEGQVEYWIIRNSWGEYWGEMSFFRLQMGTNMLGVESEVSWATVKDFTIENTQPCFVNGRNCNLASMNFIPGVSIGQL